jgi:hypothetical protein
MVGPFPWGIWQKIQIWLSDVAVMSPEPLMERLCFVERISPAHAEALHSSSTRAAPTIVNFSGFIIEPLLLSGT